MADVAKHGVGYAEEECDTDATRKIVNLWEWAFTVPVMAILVSTQPPKSAPIVASLVLPKYQPILCSRELEKMMYTL